MKKIFFLAITTLMTVATFAQSGTNSPYSQYGIGVLTDQGSGFNRGMGGVALGFHDSKQVNYLNPASYANIDSLTFIFDAGASLQLTNFNENGHKVNARNADFEYAVASFRIIKKLGASFGIIPFSNVGYSYSSTGYVDNNKSTTYTNSYAGSGGIHEVYVGAGYSPLDGLRVGANIGYVWGSYNRTVNNTFSDAYFNTLMREYSADVASWRLTAGVQYTAKLTSSDDITLGATFSPGHKFTGDAVMSEISTNSQTSVADTTTYRLADALFIPTQIGVGVAWYHGSKWHVGADYTLQKWSEKQFPEYLNGSYVMTNNSLQDRHRFAIGGEYVPNANSRSYVNRMHFRAGVGYATPYVKIAGMDGPKELSATIGLGLPIINAWNNRSMVNISAQWVQTSAKNLIKENTFRINIGVTFNERWFAKWKVE